MSDDGAPAADERADDAPRGDPVTPAATRRSSRPPSRSSSRTTTRASTIEAVAARAGVGRPTIYRRWPSKPALVVAALVESSRLAIPDVDTGSLRGDLIAVQRHQIELMNAPMTRRVTAGLIADLATDPELAERYITEYLAPRRDAVWKVLERGVERGELEPATDLAFVYDLLIGPLFMRAVVWGQPLARDAAEATTDVVLAAFAKRRRRPAK